MAQRGLWRRQQGWRRLAAAREAQQGWLWGRVKEPVRAQQQGRRGVVQAPRHEQVPGHQPWRGLDHLLLRVRGRRLWQARDPRP